MSQTPSASSNLSYFETSPELRLNTFVAFISLLVGLASLLVSVTKNEDAQKYIALAASLPVIFAWVVVTVYFVTLNQGTGKFQYLPHVCQLIIFASIVVMTHYSTASKMDRALITWGTNMSLFVIFVLVLYTKYANPIRFNKNRDLFAAALTPTPTRRFKTPSSDDDKRAIL